MDDLLQKSGALKRKVLVVDDETTIRLTLSHVLRKAGYTVSTCSSSDEAAPLVRSGSFFLVVVDLVLGTKGRLDGLETVRLIKRESPRSRVIVMTAYGSAETRRKALAEGADSYWDKPINMEKLLEDILRLEVFDRAPSPATMDN